MERHSTHWIHAKRNTEWQGKLRCTLTDKHYIRSSPATSVANGNRTKRDLWISETVFLQNELAELIHPTIV